MREYSKIITLNKNQRGVFVLDTIYGCSKGLEDNVKGCYNDCYSARTSKKYGYDFSKDVLRSFKNDKHIDKIIRNINKIELPFFRVGSNGDPSLNWEHTINVLSKISKCKKEIVIITKHWFRLTNSQLIQLKKLKVCVNTSISALDSEENLDRCLIEYERLKPYCKSVLRVVSCDFNKENKEGLRLSIIQERIFNRYEVLDTILRVFKNNQLVKEGIINIKETKFLGSKCHVSKYNKKTYFGKCDNCLDKCGINYAK